MILTDARAECKALSQEKFRKRAPVLVQFFTSADAPTRLATNGPTRFSSYWQPAFEQRDLFAWQREARAHFGRQQEHVAGAEGVP